MFVSNDDGTSWRSIAGDLPADVPVRVVREDPHVAGLLYAGTETGVFVSRTDGTHWEPLGKGLPTVPVFDIKIHARDRELVAATHGRSLWILDVTPLRSMTRKAMGEDMLLCTPSEVIQWRSGSSRGSSGGASRFVGKMPRYEAQEATGSCHRALRLQSQFVNYR